MVHSWPHDPHSHLTLVCAFDVLRTRLSSLMIAARKMINICTMRVTMCLAMHGRARLVCCDVESHHEDGKGIVTLPGAFAKLVNGKKVLKP